MVGAPPHLNENPRENPEMVYLEQIILINKLNPWHIAVVTCIIDHKGNIGCFYSVSVRD